MIENELKYVLRLDSVEPIRKRLNYSEEMIDQGYLPGKGRIRRKLSPRGHKFTFTYKLPVEGMFFEIEKDLSAHEYNLLWPHTTHRLAKYRLTDVQTVKGGLRVRWDIDFFLAGAAINFVMAEAEMPETMSEPPEIPKFLEPHILYAVPRAETDSYSSRKLSNSTLRDDLYARLAGA